MNHKYFKAGLTLLMLVLAADLASKWFIQRYFWPAPFYEMTVFHNFYGIDFSLIHNTNKGAAWGIFANWSQYLVYFRIFLIAGLTIFLFVNKKPFLTIPLCLILAGAIGNVLDYFFYGHVIDMLQFNFWGYHYPTFNVADSSIFLGITTILLLSRKDNLKCKLRNGSN